MFRNKKGAELSLNIIIISIIIIVVLVVVIAFFLGAFSKFRTGISSTDAEDLGLAVQDCTSKCQFAQSFDSNIAKRASGYCRKTINVDINSDKLADQLEHCWSDTLGVSCPGVQQYCPDQAPTKPIK